MALGRYNYNSIKNINLKETLDSLKILTSQYLRNKNSFRSYVNSQAFQFVPSILFRSIQKLIPSISPSDLLPSKKVGIRPQLFDVQSSTIVDDFVCIDGPSSSHVLNSISPAFTASFSMADLIIDEHLLKNKI